MMLEIKNLHAEVKDDENSKKILKGVSLKLEKGKVYVLLLNETLLIQK